MKRLFRARDYHPDPHRDVVEEFQSHLELKVEDLMARGMTEEEARAEAERCFGNWAGAEHGSVRQTRSRLRRRSFLDRFEILGQDIRYALRRMARSPGFTAVALLSLAIGIGANTAVFSVVNAFLIRKMPFRGPEELVRVYTSVPGRSPYMTSSYPDFLDMQDLDGVFAEVGAWENTIAAARLGDAPLRMTVQAVSSGLLPMLGVEPALGRNFLPQEDAPLGGHPVAILGHGFWQQAFGGDAAVLGRTLTVSGIPFSIVGVTPDWFHSLDFRGLRMDLLVPLSMSTTVDGSSDQTYQARQNKRMEVMGRLAPGVTLAEARAGMAVLATRLEEAYPETPRGQTFRLIPNDRVAVSPELDQGIRFTAAFLLAVVGFVLLLACTNLASLLLARGLDRQKEVAMRLALGAGRSRLIRQLLTEALVLALLGGLAGLAVARITTGYLMTYEPPLPIPLSLELGLDRTVLLFTLGVSTCAGILFGLAPALQSTRPALARILKEAGGLGTRKRFRLQPALVALQVSVSMVLLVGGGLFLRSFLDAQRLEVGFSTEPAGIAWIDLRPSRLSAADRDALRTELERRLLAEPGIHAVASASRLPLSLSSSQETFRVPGVEGPEGQAAPSVDLSSVSQEFFEVMEIPVLAGRTFGPQDRAGSLEVAVVNQEMARRYWPGGDPVGKELFSTTRQIAFTVVGVVGDTKVHSLGESPTPAVYLPILQAPSSGLQLLARGDLSPGEMVGVLRRLILEVDPGLVVLEVKSMEDHLALHLFGPRAAAILLGTFGILALLLSGIGLFGVVSFSVSRRVREMGIRVSLGAKPGQVRRLVVRGAMGAVAFGGTAGLAAAFFLGRLIRVFLVGISPSDPVTVVTVPILLGGVALAAAYIPARRATRVDPVEALRTE